MFNKKGLELPITAIIVLIISITFLGLAVYFIKTMFGEGTDLIGGQLAKIKDELRSSMEESGESFTMSSGTELEVKRGERFNFYIGIRNTAGSPKCYKLSIKCLQPFGGGSCTQSTTKEVNVGGEDLISKVTGDNNWFPKLLSQFTVNGNDVAVNPVTLQVSKAQPDTYLMEAQAFASNEFTSPTQTCSSAQFVATEPEITKRFHVTLQ